MLCSPNVASLAAGLEKNFHSHPAQPIGPRKKVVYSQTPYARRQLLWDSVPELVFFFCSGFFPFHPGCRFLWRLPHQSLFISLVVPGLRGSVVPAIILAHTWVQLFFTAGWFFCVIILCCVICVTWSSLRGRHLLFLFLPKLFSLGHRGC